MRPRFTPSPTALSAPSARMSSTWRARQAIASPMDVNASPTANRSERTALKSAKLAAWTTANSFGSIKRASKVERLRNSTASTMPVNRSKPMSKRCRSIGRNSASSVCHQPHLAEEFQARVEACENQPCEDEDKCRWAEQIERIEAHDRWRQDPVRRNGLENNGGNSDRHANLHQRQKPDSAQFERQGEIAARPTNMKATDSKAAKAISNQRRRSDTLRPPDQYPQEQPRPHHAQHGADWYLVGITHQPSDDVAGEHKRRTSGAKATQMPTIPPVPTNVGIRKGLRVAAKPCFFVGKPAITSPFRTFPARGPN